jgi:hypothetical protein
MAARKSKAPAGTRELKLTDKQLQSVLAVPKLNARDKAQLKAMAGGDSSVSWKPEALVRLGNAVNAAIPSASGTEARRLGAVLNKISGLLDDLDEEAVRKVRQKAARTRTIYRLKVTLRGSQPPIWRRIEVPDVTLGELHEILQVVMGWHDCHLHQFVVKGEYHGPPDIDDPFGFGPETQDEEKTLLSQVAALGNPARFRYEYDFGDSWDHEIVVEKSFGPEPGVPYPRCVQGARNGPPEDCGGIWGYENFAAAMTNPKHPEHRDLKEWYGGPFDPEKFSVEEVNADLRKYL